MGRPWFIVDQRQLAEEVPRLERGHCRSHGVGFDVDVYLATKYEKQPQPRIAQPHDVVAGWILQLDAYPLDMSNYSWIQGLEEVNLADRSEEHTSELQSPDHLVCRLLLEKKK